MFAAVRSVPVLARDDRSCGGHAPREMVQTWGRSRVRTIQRRMPSLPAGRGLRAVITGADLTMDTRTAEQRSRIMKSVATRHTGPELVVRKALHALGCRYGLHRKDLPGSPDIVMPSREKIILVHGCFWHGHRCRYGRPPKSRSEYWLPKISANSKRDRRNLAALNRAGWTVLVVWQCQTKHPEKLRTKLIAFLKS